MSDAVGLAGGSAHAGRGATVAQVVRDVIADVAPDELPIAEALIRDGSHRLRRPAGRNIPREPLGFGLGEVAVLTAPVVWTVVDEVVRRGVDGTVAGLWKRLRRIARKRSPSPEVRPLTQDQLAHVRKRIVELAAKEGMAKAKAEVLSDRVVARLVLDPGTKATTRRKPDDKP